MSNIFSEELEAHPSEDYLKLLTIDRGLSTNLITFVP